MEARLLTNAIIWTPGRRPFLGEVLVAGDRIAKVASGTGQLAPEGAATFDCRGFTLMPGMVEGHGHLAFPVGANFVMWGLIPTEEHTLLTMHNARTVLDAGFTSVLSAGSVKPRLDIAIRNEIAAGRIPGPRLLACSPEFTPTGGLGDERQMHAEQVETFCVLVDGADAFRRAARTYMREGVDVIKVGVSGNQPIPTLRHAAAETTVVTEDELRAVIDTVKVNGKLCSAHAKGDDSIVLCLRTGVDILYHCEYASERTLDLIEEAKDRVVLAPTMASVVRSIENARAAGNSELLDAKLEMFEHLCGTFNALRRRGVRVMVGGDYGQAHIPHGTNAKDLGYFTKYLGYSADEVLICATQFGADGMRVGGELGQIREGYIADLLLVDERPYEDVVVLQERDNIKAIMQNGRFYKNEVQLPG